MELWVAAVVLLGGLVILTAVALQTVLLVFKVGFWTLALPFKILVAGTAALFSLLFGLLVPFLFLLGIVGLAVTLPVLVLVALPFMLIGFGLCLLLKVFV